ncbi:hypothetical protein IH785_12400 [candidate division KSB1 bacterium]|nr:hypothetical protein [candidate division KSB1 bacterium]
MAAAGRGQRHVLECNVTAQGERHDEVVTGSGSRERQFNIDGISAGRLECDSVCRSPVRGYINLLGVSSIKNVKGHRAINAL